MKLLACDLGGTWIKTGLVDGARVIAQENLPAHSDQGLGARLPELAAAFGRLVRSRNLALADCAGVAVSFPSLVDTRSGRILDEYGKYRDAPGINLVAWAEESLGLPLAIENDARMALIGEWQHGAGRGCANLVVVTLGTGIGTAVLLQGSVLRGAHGQAGCLSGHLSVRYGGRRCSCGNLGCAEAEASTAFLSEIAASRPDFKGSLLARESTLDYAAVFRLAAQGDPCAAAIRDQSLLVWATLVVNLIVAYDPERVIIGGGLLASRDVILPAIRQHVDRHAHTPWGRVQIVAAELGDAGALHAGEWLLREKFSGAAP